MATLDRFPLDLDSEPKRVARVVPLQQGELFARLMLRQLPVMKSGPEDEKALNRLH